MKTGVDARSTGADVSYPPVDASREGRLRVILEIVESGAAFTIRDLAARVGLSPSRLQRLFKQQMRVCIGEWLNEQRLLRAAHLLATSYLSVKEITHSVGYEHPSSFIRAFERRFTQAPTRYREGGSRRQA
jgi:transcriptional regulator GlxA family with amidase domain